MSGGVVEGPRERGRCGRTVDAIVDIRLERSPRSTIQMRQLWKYVDWARAAAAQAIREDVPRIVRRNTIVRAQSSRVFFRRRARLVACTCGLSHHAGGGFGKEATGLVRSPLSRSTAEILHVARVTTGTLSCEAYSYSHAPPPPAANAFSPTFGSCALLATVARLLSNGRAEPCAMSTSRKERIKDVSVLKIFSGSFPGRPSPKPSRRGHSVYFKLLSAPLPVALWQARPGQVYYSAEFWYAHGLSGAGF